MSAANGAGFVWLVGAGPGDPGLLTLRAAELLRTADVVAHDELISPEVLAMIRPGAERIAVGRRHGRGDAGYRLHPAVLERALAGRQVVRLKCGDPFVFGRGGEEAEELAAAGVGCAVVPGITAALGAAATTGIPLTHRAFASDLTLATGHDVDGAHVSHSDWRALAAGGGTLVLYMAGRRLEAALARLVAAGRPAETPAAFIVAATCRDELVVEGTLATLAARVAASTAASDRPGLVIVGDVVARRVRPAARPPAPPPAAPPRTGLVLVYTGQGKGKTTAALGLAFRALGRGLRVAVVQFIKGKWQTGERRQAAVTPGLTFLVMGEGFTWESDDLSRDARAAAAAWARSRALIEGGEHEVVVLDELTYAISYGFVTLDELLEVLRRRPSHVSVLVTGRHAPAPLCELADLVTDMRAEKHPFARGVRAQPGLDF